MLAHEETIQALHQELDDARAAAAAEAADLTKQLEEHVAQIDRLGSQLAAEHTAATAATAAEVGNLTAQLETQVAETAQLQRQLSADKAAAEVESLTAQLEKQASEIAELKSELSQHVFTVAAQLQTQVVPQMQQIEELDRQLAGLRGAGEEAALAAKLEAQASEIAELLGQLSNSAVEIEGLQERYSEAREAEQAAKERAVDLEAKLEDALAANEVTNNKVADLEAKLADSLAAEQVAKERAVDLEAKLEDSLAANEVAKDKIADVEARLADSLAAKEAYEAKLEMAVNSATTEASAMRAQISVAEEEMEELVKGAEEAEQLREELTQKLSASLSQDAAAALQSELSLKAEEVDQLTRQCSELQNELAKVEQNSQASQPTESNVIAAFNDAAAQEAQIAGPPVTISSNRTQSGTDEIGMLVSDDSNESKSVRHDEVKIIRPAENWERGAIELKEGESSFMNSAATVSEGIDYLQRLVSGISASLDYPPEQNTTDVAQLSQMPSAVPSSQQVFPDYKASSQRLSVPASRQGGSGMEAMSQGHRVEGKSQEYLAQLSRTLSEAGLPPAALITQESQGGQAASQVVGKGDVKELSRILSAVGLPAAQSSALQPNQDSRCCSEPGLRAHLMFRPSLNTGYCVLML